MLIQGEPSGWMHTVERREDNRITTETESHLSVKRGAQQVLEVVITTTFVETADGEPLEASSHQNLGIMSVERTARFVEDRMEVTTSQMGQTRSRTVSIEGDWLPPAAAYREALKRMEDGQERFELRTVDPAMTLEPVTMEYERIGSQDIEVMGKVVPATAWEVKNSVLPSLTTKEFVDKNGRLLKTTMSMIPGMEVTIIASEKELARQEIDPPELLMDTLIQPEGEMLLPRERRKGTYRLAFNLDEPAGDGDREHVFDIPQTGYQRVSWENRRNALVEVDLTRPIDAGQESPGEATRVGSTMVDSEDPEVRRLTEEALAGRPGGTSAAEKAEALRTFVQQHIDEKNLSVGFGSASEVARTRQGDCTEHAVLLAAMLRTADIPSRLASGLIFVDEFQGRQGVFGYHMWTQAWLENGDHGRGRWVDLDATLHGQEFDASHITLSTSAMEGDVVGNDMASMAPLFGRLSIEVVE